MKIESSMKNNESIRVIIVDDEKLIRRALRTYLARTTDILVVGEGENGEEALLLVQEHHPDVVLMDIQMPVMDGVTSVRQIVEQVPEVRILMVTGHVTDNYLKSALLAGASGYVVKDAEPDEVIAAVREVFAGGCPLDPAVTHHLLAEIRQNHLLAPISNEPITALTDREQEVLKFLCCGMSNSEIAATLYLSESAVKQHLSSMCRKYSVRDRLQLAIAVMRSEATA